MTERRINLLLWTVAGACAAGAVLSLAFAFLAPLESVAVDAMPSTRPAEQPMAARGIPSLADYQPIFNAVLRPPPTDAPPEPVAAASEVTPVATGHPTVTLVGTIGDSLALLRNARGEIELKGVGDQAGDGATVTSIRTSRVEMQLNGQSIVLEKPKEPEAGS